MKQFRVCDTHTQDKQGQKCSSGQVWTETLSNWPLHSNIHHTDRRRDTGLMVRALDGAQTTEAAGNRSQQTQWGKKALCRTVSRLCCYDNCIYMPFQFHTEPNNSLKLNNKHTPCKMWQVWHQIPVRWLVCEELLPGEDLLSPNFLLCGLFVSRLTGNDADT